MFRMFVFAVAAFITTSLSFADEAKDRPKDPGPLELKIVLKKDKYTLETGGKPAKEYRRMLEEIREAIKQDKFEGRAPKPPQVDLVLQIKNTGKQEWVIFVGGDVNVVTFQLKGPGVIDLAPRLAFTADFRLPKEVRIEPGKSFELPIKQLSDGFRGASRNVYWTEPGEYALSATYQLGNNEGDKGPLLKASAVKITVMGN